VVTKVKACRILVVDDDAHLTELLRHTLRLEGYDVEIALDGATALALFAKMPPDLVILDLMMPGMDGFAVLEQLRQTSTVPVVVLSAKRTIAVKTRALNEGADDYVTKPFDLEELVARMNAVLRRASFSVPDEIAPVRRFDRLCVDPQKRCQGVFSGLNHAEKVDSAFGQWLIREKPDISFQWPNSRTFGHRRAQKDSGKRN
jgi:DNA-binding response OmpR family regulator